MGEGNYSPLPAPTELATGEGFDQIRGGFAPSCREVQSPGKITQNKHPPLGFQHWVAQVSICYNKSMAKIKLNIPRSKIAEFCRRWNIIEFAIFG